MPVVGNGNALSVAKVKQSSAMRMVARDVGKKSSGSGEASAALEVRPGSRTISSP